MNNPQRRQTILQCRDWSQLEQTRQNWFGNSRVGPGLVGFDASSLPAGRQGCSRHSLVEKRSISSEPAAKACLGCSAPR
jgi:hypothetical protein